MLTIRLKRHGKTHFATYRVVVQDAAKHPTSGKVVAYVGNYNPHTKETNLDKEQIEKYLSNGAQPSPRVVNLLKDAKINLPSWVKEPNLKKARTTRNLDKLRKNQPEQPAEEAAPVAEPTETVAETAETIETTEEPAAEEEAPATEEPSETIAE
jgi:small subunit ribosomal protein S16